MTLSAGFDFSSANASFAVVDEVKGVLFDRAIPMPGRDASQLPRKMSGLLAEYDLCFEEIDAWSVGAGPGSFTGLRIAAAFVEGLAFRRPVRTRGVSSAAGLAHTLFEADAPALALYDGRKSEILACGLKAEDGFFTEDGFHAVIRNPAELAGAVKNYPHLCALTPDREAIRKICPDWLPLIAFADAVSGAALAVWKPDDFSRGLTHPAYLRPAVFVPPANIRTPA